MLLRRYLYREILRSFFAVFSLLLLIFMSSRLVTYLAEAVAGKLSSDLILNLLGLRLLTSLTLILPVCLLIAVLLALGRMRRDNELTAMEGAGLGNRFFMGTVLRLSLWFAAVTALQTLYISPWADNLFNELQAKAEQKADIFGMRAGQFREFSQGERIIYVEKMSKDKQKMEHVFLQVREAEGYGVLTSERAYLDSNKDTGDRFVVFGTGKRYTGQPGKLDYSITEYGKYGVRIERSESRQVTKGHSAISSASLWSSTAPKDRAELQWRLHIPVTLITLGLLGVLLARGIGGHDRYSSLIVAICVYFFYSNLLGIARNLIKRGEWHTSWGMWAVHLLVLGVIALLYFYPHWRRWRAGSGSQQLLASP